MILSESKLVLKKNEKSLYREIYDYNVGYNTIFVKIYLYFTNFQLPSQFHVDKLQ